MGMLRFHAVELALLLDVDVCLFDYSGYGASAGAPSPSRTLSDARAAAAHLRGALGVAPADTVLYGFSLGNGPALHLAADGGWRGVVCRSAFVSGVAAASDVVQKHVLSWAPAGGLGAWLDVWPNVPNLRRCAAARGPPATRVLLVHGARDELLSMWHARALLDAAGDRAVAPFFDADMGHFDVEQHPEYLERLRRFVHEETAAPPPRAKEPLVADAPAGPLVG